jgi:hypothetical protein
VSGAPSSVCPGHELVDAGCGPEVDEPGERVGHPGERVDGVELAGLHKRGDRRPVLGAKVVAGEEGVLAIERQAADRALDRVGIDLDATVVEEAG